jgi:hypothetical protein
MAGTAAEVAAYNSPGSVGVSPDVIALDALKSDTVDLVVPVRSIRANVAGAVAVKTAGSAGVTRTLNFLAGETRDVICTRIMSTGTTATGLEGMT